MDLFPMNLIKLLDRYPAIPIEIIPTITVATVPPMYELHMKNPNPPLACCPPPPEIISPAKTTSQVMPIPTAAPVKIEGNVPGRMIL